MNQNINIPKSPLIMQHYPEHQEPFSDSFLHALVTPTIRVVPESDWSSIKALWVPRFHHDYQNMHEQKQTIMILNKQVDHFGSVQGLLTMTDSDYTPYLATLFNSTWTPNFVLACIKQAFNHPVVSTQAINLNNNIYFQKKMIGKADNGLHIIIYTNEQNQIVDAFPTFIPTGFYA